LQHAVRRLIDSVQAQGRTAKLRRIIYAGELEPKRVGKVSVRDQAAGWGSAIHATRGEGHHISYSCGLICARLIFSNMLCAHENVRHLVRPSQRGLLGTLV